MPYQPMMAGEVEVIPLLDAVGPMGGELRGPLGEKFVGGSAEHRAMLRGDTWTLHFRCYLLRTRAGRLILVDCGLGGADSPASSWAPVPGRLVDELAATGVAPGEVDTVVLTHLHSDHAAGAVTEGVATFPNARHVVQRAEVDWIEGAGPNAILERVLRPLTGLVDAVEGDAEVAPGVWVRAAPGHTPGHQVVETGPLTLTGDVILHAVQLADPAIRYVHDEDPERAVATRREVLRRARAGGGLIGSAHLSEPFTRLSGSPAAEEG
ncbi:MBL fold metallo-hydrolase [Sphaerisporangium melleum]|uniref:MBL fold metallo-hydrolase n=1 Tax=Sphaerisporangium melleum TaxID=321316 RepID=A0A917VQ75_9ACTN|nr:MBL fold metallo-hydrolase [Sphaerisporangium melleum]GGL03625.1 MBL fold metallo-hydrolase [Sphaerisporangium melleum]GII74039.1 MBL fold metallo-hydrolase [Sphaerisporangium melleum]